MKQTGSEPDVILLDTDHISILQDQLTTEHSTLMGNMAASADQDFVTTVVTIEEQMRNWLALINRSSDVAKHVQPYDRLSEMVEFSYEWKVLRFCDLAAKQFKQLRRQKIRIGTQDLKIGSIAHVQNALVLTSNLSDFLQIPNLRAEDWAH